MTFWILAALALYFVQTLLPPTFRFRGDLELVGARDNLPEPSIIGRRAERALVNVGEAMILFLPLAILCFASGVIAVAGGVAAFNRRRFGLALAGSIAAVFGFFPVGIAAVVFTILAEPEFRTHA